MLAAAYFDRLFGSLKTQAEVIDRVEAASGQVLAVDVGVVTSGSAGQWLSGTMLGAVSEYMRRSVKERRAAEQALADAGARLDDAVEAFARIERRASTAAVLVQLEAELDTARARLARIGASARLTLKLDRDWDDVPLDVRGATIRAIVERVVIGPGRGPERVTVDLAE